MTHSRVTTACAFLLAATMTTAMTKTAQADGLLFGYEGDVLASDPASGFVIANPCTGDCSQRLENGYFILEWGPMGDVVNYSHLFGQPSGPFPPPTLWVEWRFRSNQPIPPTSGSCDSRFSIKFRAASDIVFAFQNGVIDFEGGDFAIGLDPDIFHTYRFQSFDGFNYTFAVDGVVFNTDVDQFDSLIAFIQFGGRADCAAVPNRPVPVRNEWDFIRYGTIETGELIAAVAPPPGNIVTPQGEPLRSFTITFDQPAYLYVDDIAVSVTGGTAPTVVATRRLDNGPSNVLEVFIDGGLPFGQTTTFTFDTGTGPQTIAYTRIAPGVPVTSTWSVIVFTLGCLIAGAVLLRRRSIC